MVNKIHRIKLVVAFHLSEGRGLFVKAMDRADLICHRINSSKLYHRTRVLLAAFAFSSLPRLRVIRSFSIS